VNSDLITDLEIVRDDLGGLERLADGDVREWIQDARNKVDLALNDARAQARQNFERHLTPSL